MTDMTIGKSGKVDTV